MPLLAQRVEKVYLGSNAINMDAKGRLAIPTKVRETLVSDCGGRIVITAHTEEKCLLVYPEPEWLNKLPAIEKLPNINKKAARMQRLLLGYATSLEVDEDNGRILIPPTLREFAGLEKKLMLVGQSNKMELWSESNWFTYLDDDDDDGDVPDDVLSLTL